MRSNLNNALGLLIGASALPAVLAAPAPTFSGVPTFSRSHEHPPPPPASFSGSFSGFPTNIPTDLPNPGGPMRPADASFSGPIPTAVPSGLARRQESMSGLPPPPPSGFPHSHPPPSFSVSGEFPRPTGFPSGAPDHSRPAPTAAPSGVEKRQESMSGLPPPPPSGFPRSHPPPSFSVSGEFPRPTGFPSGAPDHSLPVPTAAPSGFEKRQQSASDLPPPPPPSGFPQSGSVPTFTGSGKFPMPTDGGPAGHFSRSGFPSGVEGTRPTQSFPHPPGAPTASAL